MLLEYQDWQPDSVQRRVLFGKPIRLCESSFSSGYFHWRFCLRWRRNNTTRGAPPPPCGPFFSVLVFDHVGIGRNRFGFRWHTFGGSGLKIRYFQRGRAHFSKLNGGLGLPVEAQLGVRLASRPVVDQTADWVWCSPILCGGFVFHGGHGYFRQRPKVERWILGRTRRNSLEPLKFFGLAMPHLKRRPSHRLGSNVAPLVVLTRWTIIRDFGWRVKSLRICHWWRQMPWSNISVGGYAIASRNNTVGRRLSVSLRSLLISA